MDGVVEPALRALPRFVLELSVDGRREEDGVGDRAREEAIEGRGDEMVDMVDVL